MYNLLVGRNTKKNGMNNVIYIIYNTNWKITTVFCKGDFYRAHVLGGSGKNKKAVGIRYGKV